MITKLESLRENTTIVADTGNFESIKSFFPTDVTTNPSLILNAVQQREYKSIIEAVVKNTRSDKLSDITDRLLVEFARRILEIVPGRVSTEIDARLSFNTEETVKRARGLISLYKSFGIPHNRVLIKIASTWEGIQAARILEAEGIQCNLTLLFSLFQAMFCADAGVSLISPFVGRIHDWHKKNMGDSWNDRLNSGINDPGVKVVSAIYEYYKSLGIKTEIMGASFRNLEQILALAGCDLLTISPKFLEILKQLPGKVQVQLHFPKNGKKISRTLKYDEETFRNQLESNNMTKEKLTEGIQIFTHDLIKLESLILAYKT